MLGERVGMLYIIEYSGRNHRGRKTWLCKCDCGNEKIINQDDLKSGRVKSCGCFRKKNTAQLNFKDLTGKTFGNWTVLSKSNTCKNKKIRWNCICVCGNKEEVEGHNLTNGASTQCRNCANSSVSEKNKIHGKSKSRIYKIYCGMKNRCMNPNNYSYEHYGARNIKVCDEWLGENGFNNFYNWAIENGYSDNLTIDRKDVNGDYNSENCRWATRKEQQFNKRNSRIFEYKGVKKNASEWAEEFGISYDTLISRVVKLGWSVEKAIETPVK